MNQEDLMFMKNGTLILSLLAGLTLAACSEPTGPGATGVFSMQLTSAAATAPGMLSLTGAPDTIVISGDTLIYHKIEMVVREVEFERLDDDGCDEMPDSADDFCEKFEVGPILLDLPLGPGIERVFEVAIDTGTYDEIEIEIHKPRDDTQEDRDFTNANPDFANISIRASGTYNGSDFVYLTDLNADQEMDLVPPLVIDAAGDIGVTLRVDISGWFVVNGQLVDPTDALKGGPFENEVENNIENSIDAFEDDDGDGRDDDDHEGDDDDSGPGSH